MSTVCTPIVCKSYNIQSIKKTKSVKKQGGENTPTTKETKKKGARTTIPGSDGGKGEERWWRFTVGRCTTETVWGNRIFIHWTNYLREQVRGTSQHPLALSFSPCLSFSVNNNNGEKKKIQTCGVSFQYESTSKS